MSRIDRDRLLSHLQQLPALPVAVSELLASFGDEDIDVARIAQLISRDQGLTARVLRVANSSFYGLQCKVGTISEAVVVLGFRAVRSMVLAVGVNGVFRVDHRHGFDTRGYLNHGVGVALAARAMAASTGYNPELAFTAGVLHDIGVLVLASGFPAEYGKVLDYCREHDCFLVVGERDVLGTDHGEVGGLLAESWKFPPTLFDAVARHHEPAAAEAGSLADLIHVADGVAHGLGLSGADEPVMPVDRTAWQRLDLDGDKIARALPQVMAGMEEAVQAISA